MDRPGLRGPVATVRPGGLHQAAMKGEPAPAAEEPDGRPASTGRRWTTWVVVAMPAICLLALCLVLTRGPSGRPAVLTGIIWRSVSRPLVSLRRQQSSAPAQQWGDPLAFDARPRPLDQVPLPDTLEGSPGSDNTSSGSVDAGEAASTAANQGEATSAAKPALETAPAPGASATAAADQGENTAAAQPVLAVAPALGASAAAAAASAADQEENTVAAQPVLAAAPASGATAPDPVDWAACLREDDTDTPFSVQDFVAARPARVKVEAVFQSQHARAATAVTMFVIATTSRQDYLDELCTSYGSVITLAYHIAVPANATDPAAVISADIGVIKQKFDQMEAGGACQVDVLVVSERVEGAAVKLFPINVLRNLAMLTARTELIMLGDLDMLAGTDLREVVNSEDTYRELLAMTAERRLVVVPTFQTFLMENAQRGAAGGKAVAAQMWDGDHFRYFLEGGFEPAHRDTDFPRWMTATQPYELNNTHELFEPWWIARRADIIPFDARYRGYGKNKLQHLHELVNDLGFRYVVHPTAYMVHRPHPESAAKQQFDADVAEMRAKQAAGAPAADEESHFSLFGTAQHWLDEQFATPPPHRILVTSGWRRCRDSLPFWDVYGTGGEPMRTVTSPEQLTNAAPAPEAEKGGGTGGSGAKGSRTGRAIKKQQADATGSKQAVSLPRRLLRRQLALL